jgi:hypothetical protein
MLTLSAHAKKALLEGAPHGEESMREGAQLANELGDAYSCQVQLWGAHRT